MPGMRSDWRSVIGAFTAYSLETSGGQIDGRVMAGQYLGEMIVTFAARIGGPAVYAGTAGTGAGNTVIDLLRNGTSIWRTGTNRPTLAAASTGEFANTMPEDRILTLGDRLAWYVVSVSTTGHGRVYCTCALEAPS